jgi:AraC family transcriptional regulator of adaptative response/methylated-DNA-[protein]-cysteine methyltransferase
MPTQSKVRTMSRNPDPSIVAAAIEADPRWSQLKSRSPAADGKFFYSVATTGIVCRPTCPSRHPKPENVRFHATLDEAIRLGFRPCKRCKPDTASAAPQLAERITRACRMIEEAETPPLLEEIAAEVGLSAFHFHRQFKAQTGLTPKAYADAHRAKRIRKELSKSTRVTDAIYDAGYNSHGRFYEKSNQLLGMTPTRFKRGGAGANIRVAVAQCSLGALLVAESDKGLAAILLGDDAESLLQDVQDRFPKAELIAGDRSFEKRVAQVVGFVEAPHHGLDLPLDVQGTAFQQRVWKALTRIPPGKTLTYTEIAKKIGEPAAVRAVAAACAANKLAVAIPCHRVVRRDGSLAGYRWGIERKAALLEREAQGAD